MNISQISRKEAEATHPRATREDQQPQTQRGALLDLLAELDRQDYRFIAPTPASHARVVARADRQVGETIEDLLGWSLPCSRQAIDSRLLDLLDAAGVAEAHGGKKVKAAIRVSRVFDNLFVHSAYPTTDVNSVFLGPDSHRFADFILRHLGGLPRNCRVLDYGAGAGVGGITASSALDEAFLTLADINPRALALASVNATFAGSGHETVEATEPGELDGKYDLIVTHPPFMIDPDGRAYRDGGDLYGGRLSLDWVMAALPKLAPGGRLIMHTGVSIVGGRDVVFDALRESMPAIGYEYDYMVLDPDIFGDELDKEPYAQVDRIAAIGLRVDRVGGAHQ